MLVLVGERSVDLGDEGEANEPAIWYSEDGVRWHLADTPPSDPAAYVEISAVVAAGRGFVAVGHTGGLPDTPLVWTSADGRRWTEVTDSSFRTGFMGLLGTTRQGIVAFAAYADPGRSDSAGIIWTSQDGTEWLRATNDSGLSVARGIQALASSDGELTAFVGRTAKPIEVWRTGGRAEWRLDSKLPKSTDARITQAAHGPRGWVATGIVAGRPRAWASTDGIRWRRGAGPEPLDALVAVEAGFVGVEAEGLASGCTEAGNEFVGHTWASSDGLTWREISRGTFEQGQAVSVLIDRNGTLIGVGPDFRSDDQGIAWQGGVWTAELPRTSSAGEPTAISREPAEAGCGEG